jgi:predicted ATPase
MGFYEVLDQVVALLRERGRVTCGGLKREFQLDDASLAADLQRLRGSVLLRQPGTAHAEVETCFLRALEVARRQEARSLELRAAMSLSRLWRQQGKRQQARENLAGVYAWFTEGFDTADLREARALLEELA